MYLKNDQGYNAIGCIERRICDYNGKYAKSNSHSRTYRRRKN